VINPSAGNTVLPPSALGPRGVVSHVQAEIQNQVDRIEAAYPIAKPSLADAKSVLVPGVATATTSTIDSAPSRERP
jgi:hypothetical protein